MKFKCPTCEMSLKAEPELAGKVVRCPGCNTKIQIPESMGASDIPAPTRSALVPPPSMAGAVFPPSIAGSSFPHPSIAAAPKTPEAPQEHFVPTKTQRAGWTEQDPTNPKALVCFGIGLGLTLLWFAFMYPLQAPAGKVTADFTTGEFMANVFYKHFTVSFLNTLFFCWAAAIIYLKLNKLRHQREALLLDVLPMEMGQEINGENVAGFIDHVYHLPKRLRDSLMVNRIRKALELFEVRQNVADVATMMNSQSDIDSARIGGSYTMLRAFLWAIPLLGFIGTVMGLSHAISGMSFGNVEDVAKVVGSINNVTSGLGTAFDATLLGLVFAVSLNFPMNALAKHEDEMLNDIDAFCNEILLPRLNGGTGMAGDTASIADSVLRGLSSAQQEFLTDLNVLSRHMNDYATNLDKRSDAFQATVTEQFITNMREMRTSLEGALKDSMKITSQHMATLETGIRGLNAVLGELGAKQVVIQQVKKKGWFSRGE
jgi:biopolymer transport protein ExbB/TolQ